MSTIGIIGLVILFIIGIIIGQSLKHVINPKKKKTQYKDKWRTKGR